MSEQMVALLEGDSQGPGLRLLGRTRDPQIVKQVRRWFATERRTELERLEGDTDGPRLRPVRDEEEGGQ